MIQLTNIARMDNGGSHGMHKGCYINIKQVADLPAADFPVANPRLTKLNSIILF